MIAAGRTVTFAMKYFRVCRVGFYRAGHRTGGPPIRRAALNPPGTQL